jgi:hypothetical protein
MKAARFLIEVGAMVSSRSQGLWGFGAPINLG